MLDVIPTLGRFRQGLRLPTLGRAQDPDFVHTAEVTNRLRELRLARGWTQQDAAKKIGKSFGQWVKLERGERRLTDDYLAVIARAFEIPIYALLEGADTVPIVGIGGTSLDDPIVPADTLPENPGRAPMPAAGNDSTVAVYVAGGVIRGLATKGWMLYFDNTRLPINEASIGELCVVSLIDGRMLVRTPRAGSKPERFHLEAHDSPAIFDADVRWAAPVTAIIPGAVAERMSVGERFKASPRAFRRDPGPAKGE